MRLLFLFAVIILLSGFVRQAQAADHIDLEAMEAMLKETVVEGDISFFRQHPQAFRCLAFDFASLVYEILLELQALGFIDNKKWEIVCQSYNNFMQSEFEGLEEVSFPPLFPKARHPIENTSIKQFRENVFNKFLSQEKLLEIETEVNNLNNEEIADYFIEMLRINATKKKACMN